MKKISLIMLCALLTLSLFACVAEEEDPSNINDYAAPDYTYQMYTDADAAGEKDKVTLEFKDGHAESAVITKYTGPSGSHSVTIPSVITDAKREVSGIGDEAFYQQKKITKIVLPDTVTFIGKNAFSGCSALEEIVIPESVTYIDASAFADCTSLKKVTFKGTEVKTIGDFAFLGCTALETITLPENLESIGNWCFGKCSSIKAIKTPSTLKKIGNLAFVGCDALNAPGALELSASITEIGEGAFSTITYEGKTYRGINKKYIVAPEGSVAADYVSKMADENE